MKSVPLLSNTHVSVQCSLVCMMAGSDFIKTSTGKEGVNATLAVGLVMCRAIREYQDVTGFRVGFKPAGGIRSVIGIVQDVLSWSDIRVVIIKWRSYQNGAKHLYHKMAQASC